MPKQSGLGKGLDALIPGSEDQANHAGVLNIPIDSVTLNPRQPRHKIDSEELQELADSIREHGIIQPLIVTQESKDSGYTLIAGERRLAAARIAGLRTVPGVLRDATDQDRLELALIENVQRADLLPLETAEAYRQLHEEFNLSHEEISQRVGKSRVSISNTLRLLKLPERIKNALQDGSLSEGHARALLSLPSPQAQNAVFEVITRKALNVRQVEELAREYSGTRQAGKKTSQNRAPEFNDVEENLRLALGTKVIVHPGKKGGSITIYYYSDEELNRLIDQISG